MDDKKGYIYVLTNPSIPNFVKIGYADDVKARVNQLNRTECTPYAFRIYATYEVSGRLQDKKVHELIDKLNPSLRSRDVIDGKQRTREFYAMDPDDAVEILKIIASVNGLEEKVVVYEKTNEEIKEENDAAKVRKLSLNRHHFKEIDFSSSITGKHYHGSTSDKGTLCITEIETGTVLKDRENPSKKDIVGQAIIDLGGHVEKSETLYQRYHRLTRMVLDDL